LETMLMIPRTLPGAINLAPTRMDKTRYNLNESVTADDAPLRPGKITRQKSAKWSFLL
jgi:hypothetical protein